MLTARAMEKLYTGKRITKRERKLVDKELEKSRRLMMEQVKEYLEGEERRRNMPPYNGIFGAQVG